MKQLIRRGKEKNWFNFVLILIVKDVKEMNENILYLDRKTKKKRKEYDLINC